MWHFDSLGFISVVAYDPKKDKKKDSPFPQIAKSDKTHVLVRARIMEDLDMLKVVEPHLVIDTDKSADYSFRCVVRRGKFKKFLADSVDRIDYDSHFKEVAEARSPKVQGRHSAMMSCWSAMAKLQPYSPYGIGTSYGGYDWYGDDTYTTQTGSAAKGKQASSGKASSGNAAKPGVTSASTALYGREGTSADERGVETVDDFIDGYRTGVCLLDDWKIGHGPRHGFSVNERVEGFFGTGTVTAVDVKVGQPDKVTVNKDKTKTTGIFLSNYLIPIGIFDEIDVVLEDEADHGKPEDWFDEDGSIEDVYSWVATNKHMPLEFPSEWLTDLRPDGLELLTRLQELVADADGDQTVSHDVLNAVYDDVLWENADPEERMRMAQQGMDVPERYVSEVAQLVLAEEGV